MRPLYWVFPIFVMFLMSCSGRDSTRDWYLQGGDIHLMLDWKENRILIENSTDTVFSGVILSREEKEGMTQIHVRLDNVNEQYAGRYATDLRKDFVIWLKSAGKGVLKVTMSQLSSTPYTFVSDSSVETFVPYEQGRFLSTEEIEDFLREGVYYNIATHFATSIITNVDPLLTPADISKNESKPYRTWMKDKYRVSNTLSFYQMSDYLQDIDPSTAFITKEPAEAMNLEYLINERKEDIPVPLKNPTMIRGIYIVTGNLDNLEEFSKYRQPKSLTIYFSTKNTGGLGNTKGNYNEKSLRILLTNEKIPHFIYLYKPILAKNISVHVDSYYTGDKDEMAIFDLGFFAGNT